MRERQAFCPTEDIGLDAVDPFGPDRWHGPDSLEEAEAREQAAEIEQKQRSRV